MLSWLTFACAAGPCPLWLAGPQCAVRVLYAGSALLLLAYVGSRFVLKLFWAAAHEIPWSCWFIAVAWASGAAAAPLMRRRPRAPPAHRLPQDMLACAHYGVHIPRPKP